MTLHKTPNLIGLILFWGWNVLVGILWVCLAAIAILPYVFIATLNGEIPLSISLCVVILMGLPIYAIYFGARHPKLAVRFFFGVEIPIVILTLFRLFIVRELTLASGFLLTSGVIAIIVFALSLRKDPLSKGNLSPVFLTLGHTLVLITGLYVAVLSSLYAFPMAAGFIKAIFTENWFRGFEFYDLLLFLVLSVFLFGALAFFVFPIYISYFYPKLWKTAADTMGEAFSKARYYGVSLAGGLIWLGVFMGLSYQGEAGYIERLAKMSPAEQAQEMENSEGVRKHLLNGYLYEYRYLGTRSQNNNLIPIYRRNLGSEAMGKGAQNIQSVLIAPLLYKGKLSDKSMAGTLYSDLFDSSIQRDEKKAITKALEATYNRDDVVAGLMNAGVRNVVIKAQNVVVTEDDSFAVVEVEEIYENLTYERQEIFYYFSLPEDAALTGIWIGQTDKREEMDAFIVAPRGAAQQVYEQQVRRNIDPALLEQVGPSQYRLRVFPIPVTRARAQFSSNRNRSRVRDREETPLMRMHMEYVIPKTGGFDLMPTLLEKRNVDWARKTKRTLNGKRVKSKSKWMASYQSKNASVSTGVSLKLGREFISLSPAATLPNRSLGKLAVLIDTSYSMTDHQKTLRETLRGFDEMETQGLAEVDVFTLRADGQPLLKSSVTDANPIRPFGSLTAQQMLTQFQGAANAGDYSAVVIVTDQGLYGKAIIKTDLNVAAPLYMLHLGKAAAAYDDNILDLIYRTGGGVSMSVTDLRQQIALNASDSRIVGGRHWKLSAEPAYPVLAQSPKVSALAARQKILMGSFGKPPSLEALDTFHDLAKSYAVVTPYSSMIVLVNERQKEALKKASEADDRFDRESRSGEEALSSPSSPLVSAVPEPHEWILMIIGFFMLIWVWRKRDEWDYGMA